MSKLNEAVDTTFRNNIPLTKWQAKRGLTLTLKVKKWSLSHATDVDTILVTLLGNLD